MSQEPPNKNSSNSGTENQSWQWRSGRDSARMAAPFDGSVAFLTLSSFTSDAPCVCRIFFPKFLKSSLAAGQINVFLRNWRLSKMPCLLRLCTPWGVASEWYAGVGPRLCLHFSSLSGILATAFHPGSASSPSSLLQVYRFPKIISLQTQTSCR